MAEIINTITGYYGYTVDTSEFSDDKNGSVNKALVVISYPPQVTDVAVKMTTGKDDWAIKTGDGQIIPCENPQLIYINRDNTVIELTMHDGYSYPSNSPCSLVYRSSDASFALESLSDTKEMTFPTSSGHWAYTIEGYKGKEIKDTNFDNTQINVGLVNKVMAVVPFPFTTSPMKVDMSNGNEDWGIRMGDGTVIPLEDTEVVAINQDNFVVLFTMKEGYSYPSNSPGVLMYMNESASISIEGADDDDLAYYAVSTIYNLPKTMISGQTLDLNISQIEPFNATYQDINWTVLSGPGSIRDKHYLYVSGTGSVKICGTIESGLSAIEGREQAYVQNFEIKVEQNVITKTADPVAEIKAYQDEIDHTIAIVAKSTTDKISYQWYSNTTNSYDDAMEIVGATNSEYKIPEDLTKGDYYYFCIIRSDGAAEVKSEICHVYISVRCTSISILPTDPSNMAWESERQFYVVQYPEEADVPNVVWTSSNDNIASFDDEVDESTNLLTHPGLLHSHYPEITGTPGNEEALEDIENDVDNERLATTGEKLDVVTITATTTDVLGNQLTATLDITIDTFVPVTDIEDITLELNPNNSYTLSANIIPDNATNKEVVWSKAAAKDTGVDVTITPDGKLSVPDTVIPVDHQVGCMVMATVKNGRSPYVDFVKEFFVHITHGFIAVTDISLASSINQDTEYNIGESIVLDASIEPTGASATDINWTLVSNGNATIDGNVLTFTASGDVIVKATIKDGGGTGSAKIDFSKNFTFKCAREVFVPVDSIYLNFDHTEVIKVPKEDGEDGEFEEVTSRYQDSIFNPWDVSVVNNKLKLPIVVVPENATNKDATVQLLSFLKKQKPENFDEPDYEIPDDFWSEGWTNVDSNVPISISGDVITVDNGNELNCNYLYQANVKVTITNGLSMADDFTADVTFRVDTPNIDVFIPVKDVNINTWPKVMRVMTPTLLTEYALDPLDATISNQETGRVDFDKSGFNIDLNYILDPEKGGEDHASAFMFIGSQSQIGLPISKPVSVIDWSRQDLYLFAWAPGKVKITVRMPDATVENLNSYDKFYPEKKEFVKEITYDFLPPFIPVESITDMPTTIPVNTEYMLAGEVNSGDGLCCYNPSWDEEECTNKTITYAIDSDNNKCEATLTDNILKANKAGEVTIIATVKDGLAEEVDWYGNHQEAKDFEQRFVVKVENVTDQQSATIVTLTLKDDDKQITVNKISDFLKLCTPYAADTSITIGQDTFKKEDVTKVEFWKDEFVPLTITTTDGDDEIEIDEDDVSVQVMNNLSLDTEEIQIHITKNDEECTDQCITIGSGPDSSYITLEFDHTKLSVDDVLVCNITDENEDQEISLTFKVVKRRSNKYPASPDITSLKNFGRNFTSLTEINAIPNKISGDECLMSFLQGCTSFNKPITIPDGVTGRNCLKYFMKDCSEFNSAITIPDGVTGISCMHGFLMNCSKFNQSITIPNSVTGDSCLKRFLYGCESFNQALNIPTGVSGYMCMFEFMAYCRNFNQPITLPEDVGEYRVDDEFIGSKRNGRQLNLMLMNAWNFCSTITVPKATGEHADICEKSLSSMKFDSNIITNGITLEGDGAKDLATQLNNNYEEVDGIRPYGPYRKIKNLDTLMNN